LCVRVSHRSITCLFYDHSLISRLDIRSDRTAPAPAAHPPSTHQVDLLQADRVVSMIPCCRSRPRASCELQPRKTLHCHSALCVYAVWHSDERWGGKLERSQEGASIACTFVPHSPKFSKNCRKRPRRPESRRVVSAVSQSPWQQMQCYPNLLVSGLLAHLRTITDCKTQRALHDSFMDRYPPFQSSVKTPSETS
jgi:hypothetical protein